MQKPSFFRNYSERTKQNELDDLSDLDPSANKIPTTFILKNKNTELAPSDRIAQQDAAQVKLGFHDDEGKISPADLQVEHSLINTKMRNIQIQTLDLFMQNNSTNYPRDRTRSLGVATHRSDSIPHSHDVLNKEHYEEKGPGELNEVLSTSHILSKKSNFCFDDIRIKRSETQNHSPAFNKTNSLNEQHISLPNKGQLEFSRFRSMHHHRQHTSIELLSPTRTQANPNFSEIGTELYSDRSEKRALNEKSPSKSSVPLDTDQPLNSPSRLTASSMHADEEMIGDRSPPGLWLQILKYIACYLVVLTAISLFTALLANTYPENKIIDGTKYHIWGHYIFDGLLVGLLVGGAFSALVKREEETNSAISYKSIWPLTCPIILIFCLLSVGFNYRFEAQVRSCWLYLTSKLMLLPFSAFIYSIYLRTKKVKHMVNSRAEKGMFFKINIYKKFLEELNQKRSYLMDNQKKLENSKLPETSEKQLQDQKFFKELSNELRFNKLKYLKVIPIRRGLMLHFLLALLLIQLFVGYGYVELVEKMYSNDKIYQVYIISALYPIIIGFLKLLIIKLDHMSGNPFTGLTIHLISMIFAVVPYRMVYFKAQDYEQAGIIISIKFGYKIFVYLVYGAILHQFQEPFKNSSTSAQRIKAFLLELFFKRAASKRGMQRQESISIFEKLKLGGETSKHLKQLKEFFCRFLILELVEITSLISSTITLVVYNKQYNISHNYRKFSTAKIENILAFNAMELGTDLVIIIVILLLLYSKRRVFPRAGLWLYFLGFIKGSLIFFVIVSFVIYYTQHMIISNFYEG